jgi:hypothetical protein
MLKRTAIVKILGALVLVTAALEAAAPSGWFLAGSKPKEYDCNVDSANPYSGLPGVYLRSKEGITTTGFGTMMQSFSATQYLGKRLRLSGYLKSDSVTSWGGLWMRIDDAHQMTRGNAAVVGFDNMHDGIKDRSIKGTTAWQNYSVVLDVPEGTTSISIGFLLDGPGTLWLSNVKVEVVGNNVPATGRPALPPPPPPPDSPTNLSLTQ